MAFSLADIHTLVLLAHTRNVRLGCKYRLRTYIPYADQEVLGCDSYSYYN